MDKENILTKKLYVIIIALYEKNQQINRQFKNKYYGFL